MSSDTQLHVVLFGHNTIRESFVFLVNRPFATLAVKSKQLLPIHGVANDFVRLDAYDTDRTLLELRFVSHIDMPVVFGRIALTLAQELDVLVSRTYLFRHMDDMTALSLPEFAQRFPGPAPARSRVDEIASRMEVRQGNTPRDLPHL
jgi:hypothetical protein